MLSINKANALMKKYGYKSKIKHPYIYKTKTDIGICYLFEDGESNFKEKIAIFKTEEEMELFLKKYKVFKQKGKEYNITMKLEKPKSMYSNVVYLRDGLLMEDDEMFKLDKYDSIRIQEKDKKDVDKLFLVATNLFDIYYEIKDKQSALLKKLDSLLEKQRNSYYELQLLVDEYNKTNINHKKLDVLKRNELKGIDLENEKRIKNRISKYRNNLPKQNDLKELIKDVWNLCKNLEMNKYYFDNIVEEINLDNEIKLANKKLNFMKELLKKKSFFRKDLTKAFKRIDAYFLKEKKVVDENFKENEKDRIRKKYSCFDELDMLKLDTYLRDYNI